MSWEQADLIAYNQIREHEEIELLGVMAIGRFLR
jgi:hypothetical protein